MYYSYMDWHLDFTRPQMIITIKLTTLAFNLSDAKHRAEEVIMTLDLTLRICTLTPHLPRQHRRTFPLTRRRSE
jgi:hypothetical protein